ncbi:baseplate assembly protein [Megalodesulfovibrio paquesii]
MSELMFVDTDPSRVQAEVMAAYELAAGKTLYPGDPVRLFLESVAYTLSHQRFLIDWTAKQNLVRYASGPYLDALGELLQTVRLPSQPARTTLRYSLVAPLEWAVAVPAGARAVAGNGADAAVFVLAETLVIAPGQLAAEGVATCSAAGAVGNGFVPGQINKMVEPIAYVDRVANVTPSYGGCDGESDDHFRVRVQLAPEALGICGPAEAYRYHALSAHQGVTDVAVVSPSPGQVDVYPLCGGALPAAEVIAAIAAALNREDVRPLTDIVQVCTPVAVAYGVAATWWLDPAQAAQAGTITARVAQAAQEYVTWQAAKLGRDLNPSRLTALLMDAGATRVEVTSPAPRALAAWEVAQVDEMQVVFGGMEA